MVWVVGDATIKGSETGTSFRQALKFMEIGFNLHDTMIYEKNGPNNPSSNRYQQVWEYMFVFSKGVPSTFNPIMDHKIKWDNWGKSSVRNTKGDLVLKKITSNVGGFGMRFNIWKINTGFGFSTQDNIAFEHPATFPEQLAIDHIISWSNEGDTVLDCFMGSGTVAKACCRMKRKYVGIEIAEEYCELIKKRIDTYLYQQEIPL